MSSQITRSTVTCSSCCVHTMTKRRSCCGPFLPGSKTNTTTKPSQKRATRWGKVSNTPNGEEAAVEPRPQREHGTREACLPHGGWREKKGVSMGRRRRNKTTPERIGHLSNPFEGGSGKGTFTGPPEPVARSNKPSTTSGRKQLNTASWLLRGGTLLALIMGVRGLFIVAQLEIIHYLE